MKELLNPSYLSAELPKIRQIPSGINKSESLIRSANYIFKFLPDDSDDRWQIAAQFCHANQIEKTKPQHFENALRCIYLSNDVSFRNASYTHEPNVRQLTRAVVNLSQFNFFNSKFKNLNDNLPSDLSIEFAQTDHYSLTTNERNITGCPEALYQLQLFHQGSYVGRVGFNLHQESDHRIISLTNIQGIPNGADTYKDISEKYQIKPFNLLIQKLKSSLSDEDDLIFRGLKNPKNEKSHQFYNAIFKAEKIPRYSFKKESITSYCNLD